MRDLKPPPFPHEHGAWAMLAIPLVLGTAAAGRASASAALLVPALALLFMARYAALPAVARVVEGKESPAGYLGRRLLWAAIYVAASSACLLAALVVAGPDARRGAAVVAAVTFVLGSFHAALALGRLDRTLAGEVVGMAGLACGAPLVLAASGGGPARIGIGLALLCLGYFVSTAIFVRSYDAARKGSRVAWAACVAGTLAIVALLGVASWRGFLPPGTLVAFVPVAARVAWGIVSPPPNVRVLGWREGAVAAAFAVLAAAAVL